MILIIRQPATPEQIEQMAETYFGLWIKLAVDISREILAGGGELHYDCEQILLNDSSQQQDVWGADCYPQTKQVGFESLINIRPDKIAVWKSKTPLFEKKFKRSSAAYWRSTNGTSGIIRTL